MRSLREDRLIEADTAILAPEVTAFCDAYLASDPAVRRYETSVVKAVVKQSPAVWLDEDDVGR